MLGRPFEPLPFLGNPHVQTLLGSLVPGRTCPPPRRRLRLQLPDGDSLVLHENLPGGWLTGDPVALLVHGLTGSHASTHIRRMASLFLGRGVRTFRIDLRGAGHGLPLARNTYHAGRSEDLRSALGHLHHLFPTSPLFLVGVSLGGNMSLKLAGEAASHPVPGLTRIAVINPPIDLVACAELILQPRNRFYERYFLKELVRAARQRQELFPDLPPLRFTPTMNLVEFDDCYTAPRNGFSSAVDYYSRTSAQRFIPGIRIPTLILTAKDDPFIAVAPFLRLPSLPHVQIQILSRGGHVGYLGWDGRGGYRWAERSVVEWLTRPLTGSSRGPGQISSAQ